MNRIQPFWLSADLKNLEIGETNQTLGNLVGTAKIAVDAFFSPVTSAAEKARDVNSRLRMWYETQITDATQPVEDLTNAAAAFLEGAWATGVYAYLPLPDSGGFSYLRQSLSRALTTAGDPNRPLFTDEMETGAVVLLIAGGPLQVFAAMSSLTLLLGGRLDQVTAALTEVLSNSASMQDVGRGFAKLATTPGGLIDSFGHELTNTWKNSTVGKLATTGFPASLINDLAATPPSIDPVSTNARQETKVMIRGSNFTRKTKILLQMNESSQTIFDSRRFRLIDAKTIELTIDGFYLENPGPRAIIAELDNGSRIPVGVLTVLPENPLQRIANQVGGDALFNSWKSISAGNSLNALIPGVNVVTSMAVNLLDNAGAIAGDTGNAVSNTAASLGSAITKGLDTVSGVTNRMGDVAASFMDDVTTLAVGTLFIPPAKGGIHQLNWGLGQGLSDFALNAPVIGEDTVVTGLLICTGAPTSAEVVASLRQVGTVFGIKELETLGT